MSNRELVIDLVNKLPEDMPLEDIAQEIRFVAGVNEGIAESDRGEGFFAEEVREKIKEWTTKT